MGLKDTLVGESSKSGKIRKLPNYDSGQMNVLNQIQGQFPGIIDAGLNTIRDRLSDNPDAFERLFGPQRRNFEQRVIPGIAERFTADFGEGSHRSSGYAQTLGESARAFESDLLSQKEGLKSDAIGQIFPFLQALLAPRSTYYAQPGREASPGLLHYLIHGLAQGASAGLTGGIGGGAGAAVKAASGAAGAIANSSGRKGGAIGGALV